MSKVVIVANAKIKEDKKIGNDINNFDKVIRMNRFETDGFEEYLGSKTDIWCINRKILLQKTNTYYGFYNKRWKSYKDKYPTLDECVMMTYCHEKNEADGLRRERIVTENDIHVANTYDVMNELRQRWIDIYNNYDLVKEIQYANHVLSWLNVQKKNVKDFFRKIGFVECVTCTIVKNVTNNSLRVTNVTQKWLKRCNF